MNKVCNEIIVLRNGIVLALVKNSAVVSNTHTFRLSKKRFIIYSVALYRVSIKQSFTFLCVSNLHYLSICKNKIKQNFNIQDLIMLKIYTETGNYIDADFEHLCMDHMIYSQFITIFHILMQAVATFKTGFYTLLYMYIFFFQFTDIHNILQQLKWSRFIYI